MLYCAQRSTKKNRCFVWESKACSTQRLPVEPVVSKSPPHRLENSRAEAFSKTSICLSFDKKTIGESTSEVKERGQAKH